MSAPTELLNVQIDGVWHQFPKGTRVIEACRRVGKFIPHYCYHPKLSSPGNCRMCLIEMGMPKQGPDRKPVSGPDGKPVINWIPRPQISCAQDIGEGMAIRTDSPLVKECRNGVMEFLLINHPLDCPICDQAGECHLQEYSVEFGTASSRFLEEKVKKPKHVQLGPRVTLDDERCILCSRCIRFMKEIAHDDVLGFASRGSHTYLTAHPNKRLDSNYSLNTVDICPVGALTSTDFRFKMRVWFLKETNSICTSCATGCNTVIGTRQNVVYRQTPRENDDVNSSWMCDYGRLNFHYLNSPERLQTPQIRDKEALVNANWKTALARAGDELKKLVHGQIALIASARMTNEELWLTKKLIVTLGTLDHDVVPRRGEADQILLSADRNPNTLGAQLLGVTNENPGAKLPEIVQKVRSGSIRAIVALGEDLADIGLTTDDLKKLSLIVATGILPNETTRHATVLLPGSAFAEKRGSMINIKGRLQRLNRAVQAPGEARDDWEILRDLIQQLTGSNGIYLIEDIFRQIADAIPEMNGLSLSKIGDKGISLAEEAEEATKAPASI
jgi:NADH-quinone oxidoreductase subunit G